MSRNNPKTIRCPRFMWNCRLGKAAKTRQLWKKL